MKPALEISHISKSFPVGRNYNYFPSLRDTLNDLFKYRRKRPGIFWALKDINFKAMPGETIGIIGKNGAGKTTLMKVLSRITPPTSGKVKVRGRLACLLEVGTGFHPELTGRENIFLNGSILGLKRHEVLQKFDEIVDFSGVAQFIDTPLKHFSTGMQLRLAFSVAAHLNPEILLLDEVLAVGDAEFQQKCLEKMEDVSKSGKTILFISHNLQAVRQFCQKALVLDKGEVQFFGNVGEGVDFYEKSYSKSHSALWVNDIEKGEKVFLEKIEVTNSRGEQCATYKNSDSVLLNFHIHSHVNVNEFSIGFDLVKNGITLLRTRQLDSIHKTDLAAGERVVFTCTLPAWLLNEGVFVIKPDMAIFFKERLSNAFYDVELSFNIIHDSTRSPFHGQLNGQNHPGLIFPTLAWNCNQK